MNKIVSFDPSYSESFLYLHWLNYVQSTAVMLGFYSFYTQFLTFEHLDLFVHIVLILMFALKEFIVAG